MRDDLSYLTDEREPIDMEMLLETACIAFALVFVVAMIASIFFVEY